MSDQYEQVIKCLKNHFEYREKDRAICVCHYRVYDLIRKYKDSEPYDGFESFELLKEYASQFKADSFTFLVHMNWNNVYLACIENIPENIVMISSFQDYGELRKMGIYELKEQSDE